MYLTGYLTSVRADELENPLPERFIPVDYDDDGRLWHVLYCVENIDEEKLRENRLMYLAQTDLMTGIRNRGSGENKICLLYTSTT